MAVVPAPSGTAVLFRLTGDQPELRKVPVVAFMISDADGTGEPILVDDGGRTHLLSAYPAAPELRFERLDLRV